MMKLVIPDNSDPKLPKAVRRQLERPTNHKIGGIYGKPTKNKYIGSGRANLFFDDISRKKMTKRVEAFKEMGINYEYSINDILPRARLLENRGKIIEELEWLESSSIGAITAANYELIRLAERYCPSVEIIISFYTEIDTLKKLNQFARLPNVKKINVDRKIYRNLPLLEQFVNEAKKHEVGIRVIANLGCMADCARTEEHAIIKSLASIDTSSLHYAPCTFYCMRFLYEDPEHFLRLPIIRPEDLDAYESIGVASVKLVDRVNPTPWIEKVVGHYLDGSYAGNILDLTCNFTTLNTKSMSNEEVAKIDMNEIVKSRENIMKYREMLPALMQVSIDPDYNLLACDNACGTCGGCKDTSAVKYDPKRREIVLDQLRRIEDEYLFV